MFRPAALVCLASLAFGACGDPTSPTSRAVGTYDLRSLGGVAPPITAGSGGSTLLGGTLELRADGTAALSNTVQSVVNAYTGATRTYTDSRAGRWASQGDTVRTTVQLAAPGDSLTEAFVFTDNTTLRSVSSATNVSYCCTYVASVYSKR